MSKPSWDDYFLNIVLSVSERNNCNRGKCGCVFVKDNRILTTGYAGAPPKFKECIEVGDDLEERCRIMNSDQFKETFGLEPSYVNFTYKSVNYTWNEINKRFESEKKLHCVRTIHAEQNAIIQAAKYGISLNDSTLYVGLTPCRTCAMMLISVGCKRVVCSKRYHAGAESINMFNEAGIEIVHIDDEIAVYDNQSSVEISKENGTVIVGDDLKYKYPLFSKFEV